MVAFQGGHSALLVCPVSFQYFDFGDFVARLEMQVRLLHLVLFCSLLPLYNHRLDGLFLVTCDLLFPFCWCLVVNRTTKNARESAPTVTETVGFLQVLWK